MARDARTLIIVAGLLLGSLLPLWAAPPEERENKLATLLAVQRALQEGRDHLQRGSYQAAVVALEAQLPRIDGNREYLAALCDAYRGYIRELHQANRTAEVATYIRRLEILDPTKAADGRGRAAASGTVTAQGGESPKMPPLAVLAQGGAEGRPTNAITPRGKTEDRVADLRDDPFHDGNRAASSGGSEARTVLDKAEREFAARRYDAAGRLFEQAQQLGATVSADGRERWAYCKVHGVVETLNNVAVDARGADALEREIRQAQSMSPKLDAFGKQLLQKLQDRIASSAVPSATATTAAIEVRHGPAPVRGWQIAETANFRVFHRQQPELSERVARAAEAARTMATRKWFSDEETSWSPRCDIVLHATGQDYGKATGFPAGSPGHSTIKAEGERVLSRCVDLHYDNANMERGVLPHEVTHVVLAGRFGAKDLPRWADEGMAVHSEPRDLVELHLRNLPQHAADRQLFSAAELLQLNDYPEPRRVGAFYAQSVSLVEYLSKERGPLVFSQFLRDSLNGPGYEAALRKHYNINGFADLDGRWRAYAFANNAGRNVAGRDR